MELTFCDCSGESVEKVLARTAYQTLDIAEDLLRYCFYYRLVPGVVGDRYRSVLQFTKQYRYTMVQGATGVPRS